MIGDVSCEPAGLHLQFAHVLFPMVSLRLVDKPLVLAVMVVGAWKDWSSGVRKE